MDIHFIADSEELLLHLTLGLIW